MNSDRRSSGLSGVPELGDLGSLVSDSFGSDQSSQSGEDSNGWMRKIDVSNFKQLTTNGDDDGDGDDDVKGDELGAVVGRFKRRQDDEDEDVKPFVGAAAALRAETLMGEVRNLAEFPPRFRPLNTGRKLSTPSFGASRSAPTDANTSCSPKPIYSYSCLIALALKNSPSGKLTVAEIYSFMCENFPYFRTAPPGWKNSVRHNLSLNKCFEKIEIEAPGGHGRKSCLWMLNPAKTSKMDQEVRKWREKDPAGVKESLTNPDDLEKIEQGLKGMPGENETATYYISPLSSGGGVMRSGTETFQQPMLLVRSSRLTQQQPYQRARILQTGQSRLWSSEASRPLHNTYINRTPPKPNLMRSRTFDEHPSDAYSMPSRAPSPLPKPRSNSFSTAALQASPSYQLPFSSPNREQQQNNALNQSHQLLTSAIQQSSPFSHTPPYSPNMLLHSPGAPQPHHWFVGAPSTPTRIDQLQPAAYSSPFKSGTLGGTLFGGPLPSSYETAANALNNNSLLQTALNQSPCRASDAMGTSVLHRLK